MAGNGSISWWVLACYVLVTLSRYPMNFMISRYNPTGSFWGVLKEHTKNYQPIRYRFSQRWIFHWGKHHQQIQENYVIQLPMLWPMINWLLVEPPLWKILRKNRIHVPNHQPVNVENGDVMWCPNSENSDLLPIWQSLGVFWPSLDRRDWPQARQVSNLRRKHRQKPPRMRTTDNSNGYSMPAKVPQRCSHLSFPHGTTPPQVLRKVTPFFLPIVNAARKWTSTKKLSSQMCKSPWERRPASTVIRWIDATTLERHPLGRATCKHVTGFARRSHEWAKHDKKTSSPV